MALLIHDVYKCSMHWTMHLVLPISCHTYVYMYTSGAAEASLIGQV